MISPQGYVLGEDPKNKNPFWNEGEDSSVNRIYATATVDDKTGVPSVSTSKTVSGSDITFGFAFHNLKGKEGAPGESGFSPSARVEQTETGATITVTDKSGTTTATVNNGAPGKSGDTGPAGPGVPAGGTAGQVLAKKSSTDYDTEWVNQSGGGTTGKKIRLVEETDSSVFPQYIFKNVCLAEAQYTWTQSYSNVYSTPDMKYDNTITTVMSDLEMSWNTDTSVTWEKKITVKLDADYPEKLLLSENVNANKEYGEITATGEWTSNVEGLTINSVGRMTYYISNNGSKSIKIENFNYTDSTGEHNITAYMDNQSSSSNKINYTETVEKTESLQVV